MKLKLKQSIIASLTIFSMNISRANDYIYIVKKNDTLTSILYEKNIKPIYGKNGALAKTLNLNPKIKLNRGNEIFPNMKIVLMEMQEVDKVLPVANSQQNHQDTDKNLPEQQPTNDRRPSDDFEQSFYWSMAPSLSWKNLSSTDDNIYRTSKIDALSNMNYGLGFTYGMHFEENIDVYSKLALESVSFIEDSSIRMEKNNFFTSRFNVGISFDKRWLLEVGMNDEFFLTSPASTRVEVKKVVLPEIKAGYQKDFYQYRSAKLAYLFSGTAILPRSNPGVDSKLSYGLAAELEAKLKNQSFVFGYDLKILKATGNSTDNHNIYWNYIWKAL